MSALISKALLFSDSLSQHYMLHRAGGNGRGKNPSRTAVLPSYENFNPAYYLHLNICVLYKGNKVLFIFIIR